MVSIPQRHLLVPIVFAEKEKIMQKEKEICKKGLTNGGKSGILSKFPQNGR